MTQDEAVSYLRRYKRTDTWKPTKELFGWRLNYNFIRSVYERSLVLDLIDRIKQTQMSPIDVVRQFYYEMDDILCESESSKTWAFASIMENCAGDILRYLHRMEKEEVKIR